MAIFKCKMCGGELNIFEDSNVCECEYCGTTQTVPTADDEKKMNLFNRANRLRANNEFDKAAGVYESIVAEFPEEAEAYWGLVLCKYGIEYVDDPATAKKVPTCHRSSFDSVMDDSNFEMVMEYADSVARSVYRNEAKQIEEIRKGIIEVSNNEEPYDIFICYKETDDKGDRTVDSLIAQDTYDALTEKGYRVFFSRITLEDKLGQEYEPYIFAALNSAKVMLAFGTDYEHYNAVWVKNEWSRYLQLIAKGEKKTLIPCYKDIDAYDMPKEFARLQAQDMGKVGAIQDLVRGVEKIIPPVKSNNEKPSDAAQNMQTAVNPTLSSYLKRIELFLEDNQWSAAEEYIEKVLDVDPECAEAYLAKLMAELKVSKKSELKNCSNSFANNSWFKKILRFGSDALISELKGYIYQIEDRIYSNAVSKMASANTVMEYVRIAKVFDSLNGFKDSQKLQEECLEKSKEVAAEEERLRLERIEKERELEERKKRERKERMDPLIELLASVDCPVTVAANIDHTVAINDDGEILIAGEDKKTGQVKASKWNNVVSVACGQYYTVGVKSNGTVVAVGKNMDGQCNVNGWNDIVSIACGDAHTVGLKSDGTAVATGYNKDGCCGVDTWKNINSISCGAGHTAGLKKDGTVVAVGDNDKYNKCDVSKWENVIAVACGGAHTVGLKDDGTVVATGRNSNGECNVCEWTDIVAVTCGYGHTVGLRADGTVVATGYNSNGECNVSGWKDIVFITASGGILNGSTVGIKADGSVIGTKPLGEADNWRLFSSSKALIDKMENREARMEQEAEEEKIRAERRAQGVCQHCGGEFKGMIGKKCVSCGKPKDY